MGKPPFYPTTIFQRRQRDEKDIRFDRIALLRPSLHLSFRHPSLTGLFLDFLFSSFGSNVGTEAVDEHVLGSGNEERSGKQEREKRRGEGEKRGQIRFGRELSRLSTPCSVSHAPQTGVALLMDGEGIR